MCLPALEAFWVISVVARFTSWRTSVEVSWASSEKSSPSDRLSLPSITPPQSPAGAASGLSPCPAPPLRRSAVVLSALLNKREEEPWQGDPEYRELSSPCW